MGDTDPKPTEPLVNLHPDAQDLVRRQELSLTDGQRLGITIGLCVGGLALILVLVVLALRRCRRRKGEFLGDEFKELAGSNSSKSAPTTRTSTPKIGKRHSLDTGTGSPLETRKLVRAMTLPDDYTQPLSPLQQADGIFTIPLHYQSSLTSSRMLNRYDDDDDYNDDMKEQPSRINFSVTYDTKLQQLKIHLSKVQNLRPRDRTSTTRDPFVKVFLLPDEKTSHESRVCRKNNSPKFNENFIFSVEETEVAKRTLRLSVYDVDKRRVRHCLGHALVPLSEVDLSSSETLWRDLTEGGRQGSDLGQLQFSLTYTQNSEKLRIHILRAKNMRRLSDGDDHMTELRSRVRVRLYNGPTLCKTKHSETQFWSPEVAFNGSVSFTIPSRQMDSISVEVAMLVIVEDGMTENQRVYGKVVTGPFLYARGDELRHWQDMLAQPRTPVTRWHYLMHP